MKLLSFSFAGLFASALCLICVMPNGIAASQGPAAASGVRFIANEWPGAPARLTLARSGHRPVEAQPKAVSSLIVTRAYNDPLHVSQ